MKLFSEKGLIKQTQRQVYLGLIIILLFCFVRLMLMKLKHQLARIGIILRVEPIITPTVRPLYQRLCRLGVTEQILLHVAVYLL